MRDVFPFYELPLVVWSEICKTETPFPLFNVIFVCPDRCICIAGVIVQVSPGPDEEITKNDSSLFPVLITGNNHENLSSTSWARGGIMKDSH